MAKKKTSYLRLILGIVMSSLTMLTITISSFAYWQKAQESFYIPTDSFNATEEEFTYYACVPNVASTTGYDYYDLENIPADIADRVTGLAVVRFEALTKTAYIPSYPRVNVGGNRYNYNKTKELPVIHILNKVTSGETSISNGFSKIETLIIPETVTYIQPGSFINSEDLKEVSILGNENNSGYINVDGNEFSSLDSKDIHYENQVHRTTNPYTLKTPQGFSYRYTQFNGKFEYDNITGDYFTYVVIGNTSVQNADVYGDLVADFDANTKYKLTISNDNNLSLTSSKYTYKMNYDGLVSPVNLILNTGVHYEEYIIPDNMGTMRISGYPLISVGEYIDGDINTNITSTFPLTKLNASYSSDNTCFEIKYAPSYAYESIHYRNENDTLVAEKTYSQIGAEKVYFLNQVTATTEEIEGETFLEVTTPYDAKYLQLYVKGCYSSNDSLYYIDPTDPKGENTYLEMELVDGKYRYEFRESLSPNETLPNTFKFYQGKIQIDGYPSYVSTYTNEADIRTSLATETYGTRRIYLEMYCSHDVNKTAELIDHDHNGDDEGNKYVWYVVYWYTENGEQQQHKLKMHYADNESTFMIVDIPTYAEEFKFIRITEEVEKKLDTYLQIGSADWSKFTNYSIENLRFSEYNRYWFEDWGIDKPYDTQFSVTNGSNLESDKKYDLRNKNYLVLENYGETGKTRYIPIQENLGYFSKDIHAEQAGGDGYYNLEFTSYAEYQEKTLQRIALPKGTIVNARVLDINKEEDTYFTDLLRYSADKVSARDNSGPTPGDNFDEATLATYFAEDEGNLVVQKDCTVEVYLNVEYDATSPYDEVPHSYGWHFDIKSDEVSGFQTSVVVDSSDSTGLVSLTASNELADEKYVTSSRDVGTIYYPELTQTGTVYKLTRNYANTDYEEYRYFNETSLNASYVVSPYYESTFTFGANSGNTYYGVINETTPSGELITTNENIVMFSPNGDHAFNNKYYAAFDDYGNFLTFLSFNRTQTINEGYQCLSMSIPNILSDFRNVKVYEVDSNGKIIGNQLNTTTNILTIIDNYNEKFGYDIDKNSNKVKNENFVEIEIPEENDPKLLFDYYLRQLGSSDPDEGATYRTNNIGFTYGIQDGDDIVYYYNNVQLDLSDDLNSTERYQIYTRTNYSKGITISNEIEEYKLDEQIIDGYYYNDITITGDDYYIIRFMDDKFEPGYYDLVLRKRGERFYLGYKYLGPENTKDYDYYLYMYQDSQLVETYKMDSMNNGNHYFVDICYQGTVNFKVYNNQKVLMYTSTNYTLSSLDKISRFYFGVNTPVAIENSNNIYLKQIELDKIGININFGLHQNDNNNIRYTPTIYNSQLDYYQEKVKATTATEIYYGVSSEGPTTMLSRYGTSSYVGYMFTMGFNATVQIKLNDEAIENKTIVLPHPGNYSITYNSETGAVSCYRVQDPDVFNLLINGEFIAELEVNSEDQYYEYIIKNNIVLENEINFTNAEVQITDFKDNLLTIIEKVTLTNGENKTSVTTIPAGVYSLTYSVDSSRRVDDEYLVFTYLNFTVIPSNTVTYHYTDSNGNPAEIIKQVVSDSSWKFELLDYTSLTSYLPVGGEFSGWAYSDSEDADPIETPTIGTNINIDLYPTFSQTSLRHPVIWLSELKFDSLSNIIFTLDNLENYTISSISYDGYEDAIRKYVSIDTGNSKRIVTIKPGLFEVIGYVEGGIPLVVSLKSTLANGKDVTVKVNVPYPKFDSKLPMSSSYTTYFTSQEYDSMDIATKIISGKTDSAIGWNLTRAKIYGTKSYDEENEDDYCLAMQYQSSKELYGSAVSIAMFTNVQNISFMASASIASKINMRVSLLDSNMNPRYYLDYSFSGKTNNEYYPISWDVNSEGAFYIKFEIRDTTTDKHELRIDNLVINSKSKTYSSNFSSTEYHSSLRYTTEETIYEAINETSLDWYLYNSTINYFDSYNNLDDSDESNLCLRLRYSLNSTTGDAMPGYAKLDHTFTNLKSISFDMLTTANTYHLQIIIRKNGAIHRQIDFVTPVDTESYDPETNHKEVDLDLTGDYTISFHILYDGDGANPNGIICIDNLVITCN